METTKRVRYPTNEDIVMIGHTDDTRIRTGIFMIPIDSNQEKFLFEKETLMYDCSIGRIPIDMNNVYLIGFLDIKSDEDINFLRNPRMKWCNDAHSGSIIPRNYDYSTNTGDIIDSTAAKVGRCAWQETFDNVKMYLFGHARLGYPEKVCVFRRMFLIK